MPCAVSGALWGLITLWGPQWKNSRGPRWLPYDPGPSPTSGQKIFCPYREYGMVPGRSGGSVTKHITWCPRPGTEGTPHFSCYVTSYTSLPLSGGAHVPAMCSAVCSDLRCSNYIFCTWKLRSIYIHDPRPRTILYPDLYIDDSSTIWIQTQCTYSFSNGWVRLTWQTLWCTGHNKGTLHLF